MMKKRIESSSVGRYLSSIGRCDPLDRETEHKLACRAAEGDQRAFDRMVRACLPYVVRIARDYRAWGLPLEDLIQEGNVGLVKAVRKFNANEGTRLTTYASYWIRAEIRHYVVRNFRAVRLGSTATERKAIRTYRRRPIETPEELAETSGMPLPRAKKLWAILERGDVALDRPTATGTAPVELLPAKNEVDPETEVYEMRRRDRLRRELPGALAALTDRERTVLEARVLAEDPRSLREIGGEMGLSRERIRQIEMAGRQKLAVSLAPLAA